MRIHWRSVVRKNMVMDEIMVMVLPGIHNRAAVGVLSANVVQKLRSIAVTAEKTDTGLPVKIGKQSLIA